MTTPQQSDGASAPETLPSNTSEQKQNQKPKKAKPPKAPKNDNTSSSSSSSSSSLPLSPALIDLRVGHILRCIPHENADSLYVSTIAMGDEEGTENTHRDEETGRIVRTVCSGLRGRIPLEEMQDRKVIVVANLRPVNMRGIKSAAMVLAASSPAASQPSSSSSPIKESEGQNTHTPAAAPTHPTTTTPTTTIEAKDEKTEDNKIELVQPPPSLSHHHHHRDDDSNSNSDSDSSAIKPGHRVHFQGWEYGEGKGPEKVLNPKKKQWETLQPGLYTSDDLTVVFDAGRVVGMDGNGNRKGKLILEGIPAAKCTVPSLRGARIA